MSNKVDLSLCQAGDLGFFKSGESLTFIESVPPGQPFEMHARFRYGNGNTGLFHPTAHPFVRLTRNGVQIAPAVKFDPRTAEPFSKWFTKAGGCFTFGVYSPYQEFRHVVLGWCDGYTIVLDGNGCSHFRDDGYSLTGEPYELPPALLQSVGYLRLSHDGKAVRQDGGTIVLSSNDAGWGKRAPQIAGRVVELWNAALKAELNQV